jgi:hypothetical protein
VEKNGRCSDGRKRRRRRKRREMTCSINLKVLF